MFTVDEERHVELVQKLFLKRMPELRAWVYTMVRNMDLTNDIVQECFLTVYKKADQFEEGTNFRAWVYAIARLKVLESSRRPGSREVCFGEDVLELLMPEEGEVPDNSEKLARLETCIGKLSPSSKKAIILRYKESMKPSAIATLMKWSVNAINVTLSRARIVLRECISKAESQQKLAKGA